MNISVGNSAPAFSLPDQSGKNHALGDYHGRWILLYFYPKDDTPGCTTEACGFRDNFAVLKEKGVVVLGVSADSVESHRKFAEKFSLPFTLLSDTTKEMIQAYGAWGEKTFMGQTKMGILRTSFLIDPSGTIVKIYEKVKPEEHAQEILKDLENLQ